MNAGLDHWVSDCDGDAEAVAARCEEVIAAVRGGADQASAQAWPELDAWKQILPGWFVAACVDDREVQNCVLDRWSLRAWLHWLKPGNKRWEWVGAEADGPDHVLVTVSALRRPYLKGALEWLLKTSGGGVLRPWSGPR